MTDLENDARMTSGKGPGKERDSIVCPQGGSCVPRPWVLRLQANSSLSDQVSFPGHVMTLVILKKPGPAFSVQSSVPSTEWGSERCTVSCCGARGLWEGCGG